MRSSPCCTVPSMPTIAELSQPMLRIAGRRINPRTNGPHRVNFTRAITIKSIVDGAEKKVTRAGKPDALVDWVLAGRQALRLLRRRATTASSCGSANLRPAQAKSITPAAAQRITGHALRVGRRRRFAAVLVRGRRSRRGAAGTDGADWPQHSGEPRRHRAGPHVSGPADAAHTTSACSITTPRAS